MKRNRVVLLCVLALSGLIMTGATYNDYLRKIATVICYDIVVNNSVEVTGAIALGDDVTLENGEIVTNGTDAVVGVTFDDDAAELGDVQIYSSNTGTADADSFKLSWWFEDSASEKTEAGYIQTVIDDQTTATEDVTLNFGVQTAGTLASELSLNGATLFPVTDAGLAVGKVGNEFAAGFFDGIVTADGLRVDEVLADIGGGTYSLADADNDLGVAGDFEVVGTTELDGALSVKGRVALDDGTGASPSLVFQDATDQTATFAKADSGNLTCTIETTDSLQVIVGNLRVGDGSPGVTMDGEDAYINGTLEVDGAVQLDAALVVNGAVTADTVTSLAGQDEVRVAAFSFYDVDVAASQSAAAWGVDASASVGGASFAAIPMPLAGSVIGISVYSNDACTSGSLTADATINSSATGLQAVLNDTVTTTAVTMQANDADAFTAGQLLGVKVTTTAPWVPTTADAIVVVWVEY